MTSLKAVSSTAIGSHGLKCLFCHRSFEPTQEEQAILDRSPCTNIPFCSQECFQEYFRVPDSQMKRMLRHRYLKPRELSFHIGPVGEKVEIGKGKVLPMRIGKKPKFRLGGFSYVATGDGGNYLPSESFFGKASTRVLAEEDISLGGEDGDFFNFEGE